MTSIDISNLSEKAAEKIAKILLEDDDEESALIILKQYGELVYVADDGSAEVQFNPGYVSSFKEAAQEYVKDGDWGRDENETQWITVVAWERYILGDVKIDLDGERHTVAIEPEEPKCSSSEHDWQSPYEVLGGLKENPGVQGNGGGVIIQEICSHCGVLKVTNTWAQNPETGEQGLESIKYESAEDHNYYDSWVKWKEFSND